MAGSEPAQKARFGQFSETDERRLIEAAQGDSAHFVDIYEKYFDLVYAYVARRVRERAAAEDLTSEVFRKALVHLPRFKWTGAPFGAWLLRIASNLIADRAKREAREVSVDGPFTNSASLTQSQQHSLEDAEQRARVFKFVEELSEDQRRVIVLRFRDRKSVREIASELGRSEGAVKQLQFRALENLRKQLSPQGAQRKH